MSRNSDDLTAREFQVALLIAEGFTDKAIQRKLGLRSPQTVRFHVHRIAKKLGYHRDPDRSVRVRIARDPRCHNTLNTVTGDLVPQAS